MHWKDCLVEKGWTYYRLVANQEVENIVRRKDLFFILFLSPIQFIGEQYRILLEFKTSISAEY